jgi:hypothetical protein
VRRFKGLADSMRGNCFSDSLGLMAATQERSPIGICIDTYQSFHVWKLLPWI